MNRAPAAIPVSEVEFTTTVIEYARLSGWRVFHALPGRTAKGWRTPTQGDVGFPDLAMVRGDMGSEVHLEPRLIFAELKSDRGRLRPGQTQWLEALGWNGEGGMPWLQWETYVWTPGDWPEIRQVLGVITET